MERGVRRGAVSPAKCWRAGGEGRSRDRRADSANSPYAVARAPANRLPQAPQTFHEIVWDSVLSGLGGTASGLASLPAFFEYIDDAAYQAQNRFLESALPDGAAEFYSEHFGSKSRERQDAKSKQFAQRLGLPFDLSSRDMARWVQDQVYQPQSMVGEYSRAVGEFLPGMFIPGGQGSRVYRFGTEVLVPAITSERFAQWFKGTEYEPYARFVGAVIGAVFGKKIADRTRGPLPVANERKETADLLLQKDVDAGRGKYSGHNTARNPQAEPSYSAGVGLANPQQTQFGNATPKRPGAPKGIEQALDRLANARSAIAQSFDDLVSRHKMWGDRQLGDHIRSTVEQYRRNVPRSNVADVVDTYARKLSALQGRALSGDQYLALRSELDRQLRAHAAGAHATQALNAMKTALDDTIERSLLVSNPAKAAAWRRARTQDGNLRTIENALAGRKAAEEGTVTVYRVDDAAFPPRVAADGSIPVVTTRSGGERTLFVNIGQPGRAAEFALVNRRGNATVTAVQADASILQTLRGTAVFDKSAAAALHPTAPLRVDIGKAPDQFGLRTPEHIQMLRDAIIPGTVRTVDPRTLGR